jgi:hypothetical protein
MKTLCDLLAGGVGLHTSYDSNGVREVAFAVFVAGLMFVVAALIEALLAVVRTAPRGARVRDRLFTGAALVGTPLVILVLFPYRGDALISDAASSVSNAPGP